MISDEPVAGVNEASSDEQLVVPPPPEPVEPRVLRTRGKTAPPLQYIISITDKSKLSKLSIDRYNDYYHEILHLGGHGKCEICNVAKQRRKQHKAVKPADAEDASKKYENYV